MSADCLTCLPAPSVSCAAHTDVVGSLRRPPELYEAQGIRVRSTASPGRSPSRHTVWEPARYLPPNRTCTPDHGRPAPAAAYFRSKGRRAFARNPTSSTPAVASGFPDQGEDDADGVDVVGGLADLIRLLAPETLDLEKQRLQHEDFTISMALDLSTFPIRLHFRDPLLRGSH